MKPTTMRQVRQKLSAMYPKSKPQKAPAGWDAATYRNFKRANPTLEPDAQDTEMMRAAGRPRPQAAPRPKPQLMRPKVKSPVRRRMV